MVPIVVTVIASLLGSIQTTFLMGRALNDIDVRDVGSGNFGVVNAGR